MKKRLFAIVLGMAMAASLVACAGGANNNPTTQAPSQTEAKTDAQTDAQTEAQTDAPAATVMSYADFMAAEDDTECTIVAYVQDKESWWNGATIYTADKDGAYFLYTMPCTEEEYATLTVGTKIQVTGTKTTFSDMVELSWAEDFTGTAFTVLTDDTYIADAKEVAAADMADYSGALVSVKDLTVVATTYKNGDGEVVTYQDEDGNDLAFLYDWNNAGEDGGHLYVSLSDGTNTYSFNVRSYLRGADTDVYAAVKSLKIGDKVDVQAYVYMYAGAAQPRLTEVVVK